MILDQIDAMEPWVMGQTTCLVCKKTAIWFADNAGGQPMCKNCFQKQLELNLIRGNISQWTWEYFSLSLSSLGSMKDRLLGLIHFTNFQSMERLPGLLIENLGFDSIHPLAGYVRQKALEACFYFKDSDRMLEAILDTEKYGSWQQKANMVQVGYALNSNHPGVIAFIEKMASDASPNVRGHVVKTVKGEKKIWAKTLYRKLSYDTNPLVREACGIGTQNQERLFAQNQFLAQKREAVIKSRSAGKRKTSYNITEMMISRHCDFPTREKAYELYLRHIAELLDKKEYDENALSILKMNTKEAYARLLAAAVSDDFLFSTILEKLPKQVVMLLYMLVWECENCETQKARLKVVQLMEQAQFAGTDHPPGKKMSLHEAVKKDPAYFMFQCDKNWADYRRDTYFISINDGLKSFISNRLPPPDFGHLIPVANIQGRVEQVFEEGNGIFQQLPVLLNFIAQGNLKFKKNGNKILVGSLKKMSEVCGIDEFYNNDDNELNYLKTKLLGEFFDCISPWKPTDLEDLPAFIKNKIDQYFSFREFKNHRSRHTFDYIKRQMNEFDSDHDEHQMRQNFKKVFSLLPKGEWIFTCNFARAAFYNGIDFNPFSELYEFNSLYISMEDSFGYSSRGKGSIHRLSNYDVLTLPFVRRMMFLFGALGILDLGYSPPENMINRQKNKPWLSVYDGLKYVRLTEFGNYIMGREKQFTHDVTIPSAKIEIDEHKTLLSIYGEDPIKHMTLAAVGQQINKSSYIVNYQSFLKECYTPKDVENKIQFFRDNIVEKPPAIWEGFFREVLARMNPLEPVSDMAVFRVKPDRQLLTLLITDTLLKKYVIRAENQHMLVRTADFSKVKKRLAFFGFFIS